LLQTLGLEPDTNYQVSDLRVDNLIEEGEAFNKEDILNEALAKRPDVNAQRIQIEAAQKGIKATQSGYWPRLSLFTDLGTNYNSLNESFNFSSQFFDNNLNATIGLSLSIPIFDKGVTKNNVAAAKVNVNNQQLELEKRKNQVAVEVQQALEEYRTAAQQVTVAKTQLSYARASLESVEARYNVQAATMLELTQARTRYLEAAYDQVRAKYNLFIQTIAVAFYSGDHEAMVAVIDR
jgi:outer membrane protein